MDSLKVTDELAHKAAVSPSTRVSLDDIEANIMAEYFCNGGQMAGPGEAIPHSLSVLTICVLVLRNGFTVIGKSAPADEKNFNPDLGRKFSREDAIRQIWPLMGYALRDKLAGR
jgi:hypothetical protein